MITLEGAKLGLCTSMSVLAVAGTLLAAATLTACGGSDSGESVDVDRESDRIADTFAQLRESVADGGAARVCADLGPAARDQVERLGHLRVSGCPEGVVTLLKGLKQGRRGGELPDADISDVEVTLSAVATVDMDGKKIRMPFVQERGRWKLDSFYGLTPTPSVEIP